MRLRSLPRAQSDDVWPREGCRRWRVRSAERDPRSVFDARLALPRVRCPSKVDLAARDGAANALLTGAISCSSRGLCRTPSPEAPERCRASALARPTYRDRQASDPAWEVRAEGTHLARRPLARSAGRVADSARGPTSSTSPARRSAVVPQIAETRAVTARAAWSSPTATNRASPSARIRTAAPSPPMRPLLRPRSWRTVRNASMVAEGTPEVACDARLRRPPERSERQQVAIAHRLLPCSTALA